MDFAVEAETNIDILGVLIHEVCGGCSYRLECLIGDSRIFGDESRDVTHDGGVPVAIDTYGLRQGVEVVELKFSAVFAANDVKVALYGSVASEGCGKVGFSAGNMGIVRCSQYVM